MHVFAVAIPGKRSAAANAIVVARGYTWQWYIASFRDAAEFGCPVLKPPTGLGRSRSSFGNTGALRNSFRAAA
jgi:hypothetical protein